MLEHVRLSVHDRPTISGPRKAIGPGVTRANDDQ
jgi:hypothetical protein